MSREDVFEDWMRLYEHDVLRTCLLFVGERSLAEDALQETFLKVWQHMDGYEGRNQASVRTWILSIAVNHCRDQRKSAWFRRRKESVPVEEAALPLSVVPQEAREMYLDVQRLPDKWKEAVVLHHYHRLTKKETAALLKISRAALDRRLRRAYAALGYDREEVSTDEE